MSLSGGKRKPIREAYADRRVRERCQTRETKKRRLSSSLTTDLLLLLRGLLRLLLRWHQWITSSWPRIEGYIDTLTLQMSTHETRATSGGGGWSLASEPLGDALPKLRGGGIGGPAVADHLQELLLKHDGVAAVVAPFEVLGNLFALGRAELLIEELVELLEAVVAVHAVLLIRLRPGGPDRGDPALASQVVEPLLQELPATMKPRHDRPDRDREHLGDLLVGEALHVEEHGCAELFGKRLEGVLYFAGDDPVEKLPLGVGRARGGAVL